MKIISVKYIIDYKLEVCFSNGERKVANFEFFLKKSKHESINKFLNKNKFKKVTLDSGFLSWNDGEMEISASSVYNDFCIVQEANSRSCYDKKNECNNDHIETTSPSQTNKPTKKIVSDYIKKNKSRLKKTQTPE